MRLFSQTILQDALFFIDNLFTYHMGEMSNHRFWLFICATFIWQSVHVMDGSVYDDNRCYSWYITERIHFVYLYKRESAMNIVQPDLCHPSC
ncbi:unnamed protein product [Caenorhabditis nigoni]